MTSAITSLLNKEIEQVRNMFLFLGVLSLALAWMQAKLMIDNSQLISYLSINSFYAMPILLAIAFIVGQHLITKEYYGHTQRFVESLPIKRIHMALVKFIVGYILLLLLALIVWIYTLVLASSMEPLSVQFILLMFTRLSVFILALWSVTFTFSLLGRLRIPLALISYFLLSLLDTYTDFEFKHFGPMSLIENGLFSAERTIFPLRDITSSLIFTSGVLLLSTWLIHIRDGSMIEKLASPMTAKEKTFLLVLVVIGLGSFITFDQNEEEVPFTMSNNFVVSEHRVEVSYLHPLYESTAKRLASDLALRTQALEQALPFPSDNFAIQIHLAPSSEPSEYTIELSSESQGLVLTANFIESLQWSFDNFSAFLMHSILSLETQNRAIIEPNHWLLDGFSLWWTLHYNEDYNSGSTQTASSSTAVNPYLLQAIYATQQISLSPTMLRQWDVTTDTLGDNLAMALAYSGLYVLQEQQGYKTVAQLITSEYQRPAHGDIRDLWADWLNPSEQRFEASTSTAWNDFINNWSSYLQSLSSQPAYQQALEQLPTITVSISPEISVEGFNQIKYHLQFEEALPANTHCKALHSPLPNYDIPVGRESLSEEVINLEINPSNPLTLVIEHNLTAQYGNGTRVYTAVECEFESFTLPLRIGYTRLTML